MAEVKKLVICGQNYEIGSFPAQYIHESTPRIVGILKAALPRVFKTYDDAVKNIMVDDNSSSVSLEDVGMSIVNLVMAFSAEDTNSTFTLEILSQTKRNGTPITAETFNQFYTDNLQEMYMALYQSIVKHWKHVFFILNIGNLLELYQALNFAVK